NLRWARFSASNWLYTLGDWEEALMSIDRLLADPELPPGHYMTVGATMRRALILVARGESTRPRDDMQVSMDRSRASRDPQQIIPSLASGAYLLLLIGDEVGARALVDELLAIPADQFLPITGALTATSLMAVLRLGHGAEYVSRFT